MANVDYETKMNSKPYKFFDAVYRLLIINVLTVVLSLTVVGLFPAFVACVATSKQGNTGNVFKLYFKNFLHYFKKSCLIGVILVLLYFVSGYAIYFYSKTEIESVNSEQFLLLFLNAGFLVSFISFIVINLLSAHLPLLIITFEKLTVGEIFKTSFYITFRYFLTTLILFVLQMLIIVVFVMCWLVNPGILAIWLLFGVSLPAFLQAKCTQVIYYKFSQIDFEKIMHQIDDEEEE